MGGKMDTPAAPDYTAVAQADTTAANNQFQLGEQQLTWAQNQFNDVWPSAQQYMTQQNASSADETKIANQQEDFYKNTYQPIETQFANQATTYDSPAQASANAGSAEADVASSFDQNRASSLSSLESYGIDPSQTRYGALDLGTRISQAAATAAAGTQSNLNTQATGLALEGEAVNVGRGYPSAVANSYSTATGAGASGINTANNTTATGANTMGTSTQYQGLGNTSLGNVGSVTGASGQYGLGVAANNNAVSANNSQGIGSLIGGALGIAGMMMM